MSYKKSFLVFDMGNGDRLYTKKHENLVEGREIGDEMREYCWDSENELLVYEADVVNTNDARLGPSLRSQSTETLFWMYA